jgi:hypothetical protein
MRLFTKRNSSDLTQINANAKYRVAIPVQLHTESHTLLFGTRLAPYTAGVNIRRHSLHRFCWIAISAFLLAALAPVVSQVLTKRSQSWIEVCSDFGPKWVSVTSDSRDDSSTPARTSVLSGANCLYCVLQGAGMLPTPLHETELASAAPVDESPAYVRTALFPEGRWTHRLSRAPPGLST